MLPPTAKPPRTSTGPRTPWRLSLVLLALAAWTAPLGTATTHAAQPPEAAATADTPTPVEPAGHDAPGKEDDAAGSQPAGEGPDAHDAPQADPRGTAHDRARAVGTVLASPSWRAQGWTWDIDARLSAGWRPNGASQLAGAQLRAGAMLRMDPTFLTIGLTGRSTWSGVPGIGVEVESLSTLAGLWGAAGVTGSTAGVHAHGTVGWTLFAVEIQRAWVDEWPEWSALLALRIPLGWVAQAAGLRGDGVPGRVDP